MNYESLVLNLAAPASGIRRNFDRMSNTEIDFLHAAVGISTEAGELLDAAKKIMFYGQDIDQHRENIIEELGDLMFYLELACISLRISPDLVKQKNRDKLLKRYSSGSFSQEAAATRADKKTDYHGPDVPKGIGSTYQGPVPGNHTKYG